MKKLKMMALVVLVVSCFAHPSFAIWWHYLPGEATDVGAGGTFTPDMQTSIIGPWFAGINGRIFSWDEDRWRWDVWNGWATSVAVSPWGVTWVVNSWGDVFESNGSGGWHFRTGDVLATDIGIGGDDTVWIIGNDGKVYVYLGGNEWEARPAPDASDPAVRIAVDDNGFPWVVTQAGLVFRWSGWYWSLMNGPEQNMRANDIAIDFHYSGSDVYVVGREKGHEGHVHRWSDSEGKWSQLSAEGYCDGVGRRISVSHSILILSKQGRQICRGYRE